jgi:hypothetical protein
MRLPIERYSTSRKKSPATGVFGSGAWPFLPIQRSTALLAGAIGSNSIPKTFSRRVPAAVTLRNVVSKPAVPLGCSPLRK